MILLECLNDQYNPESSPTPSHLPKPCMRLLFSNKNICFKLGRPSDNSGQSPIINVMDNPPIIPIGPLRRLVFYISGLPSDVGPSPINSLLLDNPLKPLNNNSCTHSYHSRVPQCIWKCMMPIPIQFISPMQIYLHEYTRIVQITQSCYEIIHFITSN